MLNGVRSSNQVLCDNLEGWDGVGGESEVKGGDTRMPMADSYMTETNAIL